MRPFFSLAVLGLALALGPAHAASDKPAAAKAAASKPAEGKSADAKPAQQSRMKTCNGEAKSKGLKGDERKAFMSECLKKKG